ncbi:MAG: glycosyltransferase family 39 protein [Nitrososphaerales archaeon]
MDNLRFLSFLPIIPLSFLHFFLIPLAKEPVFDENYYIPAGLDLLEGKFSNLEHPFLGKLWVSLGILLFGNNPLGWRFFYVILGILALVVYWLMAKEFYDELRAFFALSFLSLENLFFTHSSLALLDIPSILFSLLALLLILKKRYYLAALSLGIALLNKESALLFILVIFIFLIFTEKRILKSLRENYMKIFLFLLILSSTFLLPLTLYDFIYKPKFTFHNREWVLNNGLDHAYFIYIYASTLTMELLEEPEKGNFAWNWIIPSLEPYKPLGYYYSEQKDAKGNTLSYVSWVGMGNLFIWWGIWLILPFSIYNIIFRRANRMDHLSFSWIAGSYFPFLYLSLFTNRVVYPFYFLNTVPILTLSIPYYFNSLIKDDFKFVLSMILYLFPVVFFFFYYFPYKLVI